VSAPLGGRPRGAPRDHGVGEGVVVDASTLSTPADLLERLYAEPGGSELLAAATPGAFLVGGAVRDLLLDRHPRELDVVVEEEGGSSYGHAAAVLAGALARSFGVPAATNEHERFGTATVEWDAGRIDVAAARHERYPAPGALPEVEPAPLAEDLLRRDFTVNALALALDGERPGELHAAPHALEDLRAGRLRVLHEQSFVDDPTRLWRLARYRARLGFAVEEHTAELAAAAVAEGALQTVSGARVGAELRLALAEPDPLAALGELKRLGLLAALHPRLRFEPPLVRRALELLPADGGRAGGAEVGRPDLLLLCALVLPLALRAEGGVGGHPQPEIAALLDRLEFPAAERDRVAAAAAAVPSLVDELPHAARPSELRALALPVAPEGVALAGAVSEPAAAVARRWLTEIRHVGLAITGTDLLAAGVPQGPEIGRRLEAALRMRLDGELADGPEAELAAALEHDGGE
jgi:tRNA nucleotidyltransferase (CCA-adding enzyme)